IWNFNPTDEIEDGGLARSRCPKDNRDSGRNVEVNIEFEFRVQRGPGMKRQSRRLACYWRMHHLHGHTEWEPRLIPYTIERVRKDINKRTSEVWLADA